MKIVYLVKGELLFRVCRLPAECVGLFTTFHNKYFNISGKLASLNLICRQTSTVVLSYNKVSGIIRKSDKSKARTADKAVL